MCGTKIIDPLANLRIGSRPSSVQGQDREYPTCFMRRVLLLDEKKNDEKMRN